ncbi:hypothetical protein WJX72_000352 [[Myrmecia] bisecta]|uniref:cellulase n=1 Tax=[Myrmecia] bisecta TaxID=41462 RepID=A0AAW1PFU5_9CHLO
MPRNTAAQQASGQAYDYNVLLGNSLWFYEAQRSGRLPAGNRVPWRGDSALGDRHSLSGSDLTGGLYDAGDGLKLTFPLAYTLATLAYGILEFEQGYKAAGQFDIALSNLRWGTDYLIKCHIAPLEYVVQVGLSTLDHSFWGRPEDMTMPRPAFAIDASQPSSDLLGAVAAALAASALVFRRSDAEYAGLLLSEGQSLFSWATASEGKYTGHVPDKKYPSNSYLDDLTLAATWLYFASAEHTYLQQANMYWTRSLAQEGSQYYKVSNWENQLWTAGALLAQLQLNDAQYIGLVEGFLDTYITGGDGVVFTPKGLAWTGNYAPLRNAMGAAFVAQAYASWLVGRNQPKALTYQCFAQAQIRYAAGDSGQSFIVGFGNNPPTHATHRAASCPYPQDGPCDVDTYRGKQPNAHVLYGALVGGPLQDDSFLDARTNFLTDQVGLDFNAGLTGAAAAMLMPGQPDWSYCQCILQNGVSNCPVPVPSAMRPTSTPTAMPPSASPSEGSPDGTTCIPQPVQPAASSPQSSEGDPQPGDSSPQTSLTSPGQTALGQGIVQAPSVAAAPSGPPTEAQQSDAGRQVLPPFAQCGGEGGSCADYAAGACTDAPFPGELLPMMCSGH